MRLHTLVRLEVVALADVLVAALELAVGHFVVVVDKRLANHYQNVQRSNTDQYKGEYSTAEQLVVADFEMAASIRELDHDLAVDDLVLIQLDTSRPFGIIRNQILYRFA